MPIIDVKVEGIDEPVPTLVAWTGTLKSKPDILTAQAYAQATKDFRVLGCDNFHLELAVIEGEDCNVLLCSREIVDEFIEDEKQRLDAGKWC